MSHTSVVVHPLLVPPWNVSPGLGRAVIVKSGNMSMGVNLVVALAKRVAQTLDEDFDIGPNGITNRLDQLYGSVCFVT